MSVPTAKIYYLIIFTTQWTLDDTNLSELLVLGSIKWELVMSCSFVCHTPVLVGPGEHISNAWTVEDNQHPSSRYFSIFNSTSVVKAWNGEIGTGPVFSSNGNALDHCGAHFPIQKSKVFFSLRLCLVPRKIGGKYKRKKERKVKKKKK